MIADRQTDALIAILKKKIHSFTHQHMITAEEAISMIRQKHGLLKFQHD